LKKEGSQARLIYNPKFWTACATAMLCTSLDRIIVANGTSFNPLTVLSIIFKPSVVVVDDDDDDDDRVEETGSGKGRSELGIVEVE